jgi:hypothetical protein
VSSRAHPKPGRVSEKLAVHDIRQPPFQASHRFLVPLALGSFPQVVGPARVHGVVIFSQKVGQPPYGKAISARCLRPSGWTHCLAAAFDGRKRGSPPRLG